MFLVIYHWDVKPELENEFVRLWKIRTDRIRRYCGSYGSRLQQDPDGNYVAIALWPTRESWEQPASLPECDKADAEAFAKTLRGRPRTQLLETIDDLWDYPSLSRRGAR